jgi:hypothetical protein
MAIDSQSRVSLMLDAWLEQEDTLRLEHKKLNEQQKVTLVPGEGGKKGRRMKDESSLNYFSPWKRKR